jgi:hypothetical protein
MKTSLKFFSIQILINFVITKILDILIYKIFDSKVSEMVDLDYFMYSRPLIISLVILLFTFFLYDQKYIFTGLV